MKKIGSKAKKKATYLSQIPEEEVDENIEPSTQAKRHTSSMNRQAGIEDEDGMDVKSVIKWAKKDFKGNPVSDEVAIGWLNKLLTLGNQSTDRKRIINQAIERLS